MINQEFLEFLGPAAYELEKRRDYPMEAVLTQVHLETGGLSAYPEGSNNVLGIKWNGTGECVEAWTTEQDENGNSYRTRAKFQKFGSLVECLERWADLMDKPHYSQARPFRHNWAAFLALIWHNGEETVYATDKMYLWKAVKRAAEVGIPEWCATYRARMQAPKPVRVDLNGTALDGYRLEDGRTIGPVRPWLDEMARLGIAWVYRDEVLTVTAPRE